MFESDVEKMIIVTAIFLWLGFGWYLNYRLENVHHKLDRILNSFDGLRNYLYEIDPQFDDERFNRIAFENEDSMFAGMNEMELLRKKVQEGKRTLNTSFTE